MITVRRWSEWVMAAYVPDPGNPFGDRLLYVADRRESVAPQGKTCGCERPFGYDGNGPAGLATTAGPNRTPTVDRSRP